MGASSLAMTAEPLYFDVNDGAAGGSDAATIEPWKTIRLQPDYGGLWVVAGDLDGDGTVEIVSAENFNEGDVHYTSAVVAQRLDGSVLWTWGDPDVGRKKWHHDVAGQIYDWDGDGRQEVVLCDRTSVVELYGPTGKENRRFSIPKEATDCLVFCNLAGDAHPSEALAPYGRHHRLVDWTGDGTVEFAVAGSQGLYDYRGKRIGRFAMPASVPLEERNFETSALVGDMTGDGAADILLVTPRHVYVYKNPAGGKSDAPSPLGTGVNVTLY
jgi:hypothetical protein